MWSLLLTASALAGEPSLTGAYVLADSAEAVQAAHAAAVDAAAAQLPWAFRAVARPVLNQVVRSCQRLDLQLDPAAFRVQCDAEDPFRHDRAAPAGTIPGEDGEPVQVRFDAADHHATLTFSSAQGGQRITYAREGERLRVTTELFGEQLPKPVSWTVRYRPGP